jgi:hypothetical protein
MLYTRFVIREETLSGTTTFNFCHCAISSQARESFSTHHTDLATLFRDFLPMAGTVAFFRWILKRRNEDGSTQRQVKALLY